LEEPEIADAKVEEESSKEVELQPLNDVSTQNSIEEIKEPNLGDSVGVDSLIFESEGPVLSAS
jgi:hypothetical protein